MPLLWRKTVWPLISDEMQPLQIDCARAGHRLIQSCCCTGIRKKIKAGHWASSCAADGPATLATRNLATRNRGLEAGVSELLTSHGVVSISMLRTISVNETGF